MKVVQSMAMERLLQSKNVARSANYKTTFCAMATCVTLMISNVLGMGITEAWRKYASAFRQAAPV